ncbi:MAG: DUF2218 domain-containing protein [Lautropia sp.]
MIQARADVPTPEASRWLQRLCRHFSRKIAVRYDEREGHAEFPWGTCRMWIEGPEGATTLHFDCAAQTDEALARVRFAIDEHIRLFSRKNPLAVHWHSCPPERDDLRDS